MTAATAVACAALLGAAVVSRLNTGGIGLTPDSFRYLGMARTLADGHGYASPFGSPGLPPETGFPPLYPTLLAAADVAGMSVLRWAVWINAAAFAALIALVAAMVYDLSRSALATVLGAALTLTVVPLLDLYVHVWSEPAYLIWQVLALWMLARYNARGARTDLAIAGVAASLGALTRYAGLALLPAGLIVLLAAGRRPLRTRLVDSAAYGDRRHPAGPVAAAKRAGGRLRDRSYGLLPPGPLGAHPPGMGHRVELDRHAAAGLAGRALVAGRAARGRARRGPALVSQL